MGWVTVVSYFLAALLCIKVWARGDFGAFTAKKERVFWISLALLLGFLTVNKQLDLQSFLTATGRCVSKMQGWYGERKPVQLAFVLTIIVLSIATCTFIAIRMRRTFRRTALAIFGLMMVLAFVGSRAIGFHNVDQIINYQIEGVRMNWMLELSGVFLIVLGAIFHPKLKS